MASHSPSTSSTRPKAPRKTQTIGVRLTPDQIAAVDEVMAAYPHPACWSRAGTVAWLATEKLRAVLAETRRTARPRRP